jgi:hypothetical protein
VGPVTECLPDANEAQLGPLNLPVHMGYFIRGGLGGTVPFCYGHLRL